MESETKVSANLMDVQQAANYLGLSVGTIYQWRCQHKIPYIKVGRKLKFKKDQLDQWLADRTVHVGIEPRLRK